MNLEQLDYYEIISKGSSWLGAIGPLGSMNKRNITTWNK
jgi:hypothetical protein